MVSHNCNYPNDKSYLHFSFAISQVQASIGSCDLHSVITALEPTRSLNTDFFWIACEKNEYRALLSSYGELWAFTAVSSFELSLSSISLNVIFVRASKAFLSFRNIFELIFELLPNFCIFRPFLSFHNIFGPKPSFASKCYALKNVSRTRMWWTLPIQTNSKLFLRMTLNFHLFIKKLPDQNCMVWRCTLTTT